MKTLELTAAEQSLIAYLSTEGYQNFRMIKGDLCGTLDFLTTHGLVVGLNTISYERRYCYQHRDEATAALAVWDGTDHPPGNWIKLKGTYRGQPVDQLNPNWK